MEGVFYPLVFPVPPVKCTRNPVSAAGFLDRLNSILLLIQYHIANISARYFYIFAKVYDHAMHNLLKKTASPDKAVKLYL